MNQKRFFQILTIIFTVMVSSTVVFARPPWQGKGFSGNMNNRSASNPASLALSLPKESLSQDETQALIKMREEEKLARDVYKTLYNTWRLRIFDNIATSEQRHMDAIKAMLKKYNIPDPVTDDSVGMFSNAEMGNLYKTLTAKGNTSTVNALLVGATIEDLDIFDLKECLKKTDNKDISLVFQNLMKGSRNHLRAFSRMLKSFGQTYNAQYLSQDEVNSIINSPMERGPAHNNQSNFPFRGKGRNRTW